MTMRRIALLVLAVITITLGGCAVSPQNSRLDEYKAGAEELHATLDGLIPPELAAQEPIVASEVRYATESGRGDDASSPAYWQITSDRGLRDEPGASERAFEVLDAHLRAEGWEHTPSRLGDDVFHEDEYRLAAEDGDGGWYISLQWNETVDTSAETLQIYIQTPTTTRGESPPAETP